MVCKCGARVKASGAAAGTTAFGPQQSVFKRSGDRFVSRKRVKPRSWSPVSILSNRGSSPRDQVYAGESALGMREPTSELAPVGGYGSRLRDYRCALDRGQDRGR